MLKWATSGAGVNVLKSRGALMSRYPLWSEHKSSRAVSWDYFTHGKTTYVHDTVHTHRVTVITQLPYTLEVKASSCHVYIEIE